MDIGVMFQQIFVLYGIGALGYFARKKKVLNENASGVLTQLILYMTLPALIMYSMDRSYNTEVMKELIWLLGMSAFVLSLSCVLAYFMASFAKIHQKQKGAYEGLIIFGNQGFIGYALILSLFPDKGALYVTIFNFLYLLLIWTYGIYLFIQKRSQVNWRQIFFNPGILSTLAGFAIFFLPIHWPMQISDILKTVGDMTIPLSMIVIGSFIAEVRVKHVFTQLRKPHLWLIASARLVLIPLFLLPFAFFSLPFILLVTAILVTATPSAPTMALYAQKFGGDREFASIGVSWTTLLSVFTLPTLFVIVQLIYH